MGVTMSMFWGPWVVSVSVSLTHLGAGVPPAKEQAGGRESNFHMAGQVCPVPSRACIHTRSPFSRGSESCSKADLTCSLCDRTVTAAVF